MGYHSVVSDEEKEEKYKADPYTLSVTQFSEQMEYLYTEGYQTLSMHEVDAYYNGTLEIDEKSVVITFDDGHLDVNTVIKPILESYGFQATAFVIGKRIGSEASTYAYLDELDINNDEVMQYYSHSYNLHRIDGANKIVETLSMEELQEDFDLSEGVIDYTYYAYPYGVTTDELKQVCADNGVSLAFSYNQFRDMDSDDDRYELPRYMIVDMVPMFYFKWIVK